MGTVLAIILGIGIGMSLGMLGGGGSTLAVPVLVFVAGLSAQDATTTSLLVVGAASAVGAIDHHRRGNVRLGSGMAFGAAGLLGARLGTTLNHALDQDTLLLAFAVLIAAVATKMYRSASLTDPDAGGTGRHRVGSSGDSPAPSAGNVLVRPAVQATSPAIGPAARLVRLAAAATGVGLLTGLFGVGGGFAVVPALTLLLGFTTREAIGTSLVVITINAVMALGLRAGHLDLDWHIVVPFLATVTLGVMVGTRAGCRLDTRRLTRSFAVLLILVAAYTALGTVL